MPINELATNSGTEVEAEPDSKGDLCGTGTNWKTSRNIGKRTGDTDAEEFVRTVKWLSYIDILSS